MGQKPASSLVSSFSFCAGKPMSRASLTLIVILVLIVAGLVWLSHRNVNVTPHHVEKVVTLNGAADAQAH
jgi:hypothetical protein